MGLSLGGLQKKYGDQKALRIAAEIGADSVDFSTEGSQWKFRDPASVYHGSDEEIFSYFHTLGQLARKLGLEISQTHGRITGFKNQPEEDSAFVENARRDCLAAAALGAPVCVIHSVTTIFLGADAAPERMRSLNFEMFTRILPFARQYGIKIACETFGDATGLNCCDFFGNIEEFQNAYNRICAVQDFKEHFTVCVDTGHSNKAMRFHNPTPGDVIRRLGSAVTVLHLNDNDTFTDQHKIPLTDTIDWNDVFSALDEIGYSGCYNMEINLRHFGESFMIEEAAFAVKVMRHLLKERYGCL